MLRRLFLTVAVALAALVMGGTGATATTSPADEPVQAMLQQAGPFATTAECNRIRREYDLNYTVSHCWGVDPRHYFNYW